MPRGKSRHIVTSGYPNIVPGMTLEHLRLINGFCIHILIQILQIKSWHKGSIIKAVGTIRKKEMGYKSASKTFSVPAKLRKVTLRSMQKGHKLKP
jgi:hypothetical protein